MSIFRKLFKKKPKRKGVFHAATGIEDNYVGGDLIVTEFGRIKAIYPGYVANEHKRASNKNQ